MQPPMDVVSPGEARLTDAESGPKETLLWGGWHAVPFDPSIRATLARGIELDRAGRFEEALEVINHALADAPRAWILLECRGALHAAAGFWRAAERDFGLAIQVGPGRAETWLALGCVRRELGLRHGSQRALEKARRMGISAGEIDWIVARSSSMRSGSSRP